MTQPSVAATVIVAVATSSSRKQYRTYCRDLVRRRPKCWRNVWMWMKGKVDFVAQCAALASLAKRRWINAWKAGWLLFLWPFELFVQKTISYGCVAVPSSYFSQCSCRWHIRATLFLEEFKRVAVQSRFYSAHLSNGRCSHERSIWNDSRLFRLCLFDIKLVDLAFHSFLLRRIYRLSWFRDST